MDLIGFIKLNRVLIIILRERERREESRGKRENLRQAQRGAQAQSHNPEILT